MAQITDLFEGHSIRLEVAPTRHTPAQREAIKATITTESPQKLRYNCLVAEALNEALQGGENGTPVSDYQYLELGDHTFQLNPRARSQFGMDHNGVPYLTTSLVHVDSSVRYAFTWRGDNVPADLMRLAVAHDQGKNTPGYVESLQLDDAEIHIIGEKRPGQAERAHRDRLTGRNHDTRAHLREHRPTHRRICETDLVAAGLMDAPEPRKRRTVAKKIDKKQQLPVAS